MRCIIVSTILLQMQGTIITLIETNERVSHVGSFHSIDPDFSVICMQSCNTAAEHCMRYPVLFLSLTVRQLLVSVIFFLLFDADLSAKWMMTRGPIINWQTCWLQIWEGLIYNQHQASLYRTKKFNMYGWKNLPKDIVTSRF